MFDCAGAALAASLAVVDPVAVDDEVLVDAVCGWERLASWVAAGQLAALAELARRRRPVPGGDQGHPELPSVSEFVVDEVAAALRLSRSAAGTRLHVAVEVAERLPETGAALRRGELDLAKTRRIVDATAPLPAEAAALVERRVLPRAATQTVSHLRASLARAVLAVHPAGAEERHRRAVADRRVCISPQDDGMAELWALLPADGAAAIRHALDAVARRSGRSDRRTMDNRRADALVELAMSALRGAPALDVGVELGVGGAERAGGARAADVGRAPAGGPGVGGAALAGGVPAGEVGAARPGGAGVGGAALAGGVPAGEVGAARPGRHQPVALRADVHVTVSAGTLLGLSDEPGELAGHGPIPASMARRLAMDGTWRRILTDPACGSVLDVGRRSYAPPAALADHVIVRDRTCRFPGCAQPARRCDLDHTVPYPRGTTSVGNLAALCRHHHRLKHLAGWKVEQPEPGVLVWTSPTGHRYPTRPPAA